MCVSMYRVKLWNSLENSLQCCKNAKQFKQHGQQEEERNLESFSKHCDHKSEMLHLQKCIFTYRTLTYWILKIFIQKGKLFILAHYYKQSCSLERNI